MENQVSSDHVEDSAATSEEAATTSVISRPYYGGDVPPPPPPVPPIDLCEIERAGTIISNPYDSCDLLKMMWLRPAQPIEKTLIDRFVTVPGDLLDQLPLYEALKQAKSGAEPRAAMSAAAWNFVDDTSAYVSSLADLGEPVASYPQLAIELSRIPGRVELAVLLEEVEAFLGQPLADYLASTTFTSSETRVWQSLFALSLGATTDPNLAIPYVLVLRINAFLTRLEAEVSEETSAESSDDTSGCSLTGELCRKQALGATAVLPEGVVPPPICVGVQLLGVGDLKVIRQCLQGYQPGEVARITNVMPKERLELVDRELERRTETVTETQESGRGEETGDESSQRSELHSEVHDLVTADTLCSQYNNLTQSYGAQGGGGSTPSLTLNGNWVGQEGVKERADDEAKEYAQSLTQRAAQHIREHVTRSRVLEVRHEHEKVDNHDIDNRDGNQALIGIYRWLLKRYRLYTEDAGKRMIVEFVISDPAQSYIHNVETGNDMPIAPPPSLESEGIYGPEYISGSNYLYFASLYGVDELDPPPVKTLQLVADFKDQSPVQSTQLDLPPGYEAKQATASYLLSDSTSLLGYIGDQTFTIGDSASSSADDTDSTTGDGQSCPQLPDPFEPQSSPPQPLAGTKTITPLQTTGQTLPIGVLSSAAAYQVSIQVEASTHEDELYEAWQTRTYDALLAGHNRAQAEFNSKFRRRVARESNGNERRIERQALEKDAKRLLWRLHKEGTATESPITSPVSPPNSPPISELPLLRFFDTAFEWVDMTYAFYPWPLAGKACVRDPRWPGQAVVEPETDALFKSFLEAKTARVLVPVKPGSEQAIAYFLATSRMWSGTECDAPVSQLEAPIVADVLTPPAVAAHTSLPTSRTWEIEIPTSMVVLQPDSTLPEFGCPKALPATTTRRDDRPEPATPSSTSEGTSVTSEPTGTARTTAGSSPSSSQPIGQTFIGNPTRRGTAVGKTRAGRQRSRTSSRPRNRPGGRRATR